MNKKIILVLLAVKGTNDLNNSLSYWLPKYSTSTTILHMIKLTIRY